VRLTEPVVNGQPSLGGPSYIGLGPDGATAMFVSHHSDLVPGDTNRAADVFIRHVPTGVTQRILGLGGAEPNGGAGFATLTRNGRYVFFSSTASNLVANDPNGGLPSVFRHDLSTGATTLVNIPVQYQEVSGDGRYITYHLGNLKLVDLQTGTTSDFLANAAVGGVAFNHDGSIVAFQSSFVSTVYNGLRNQVFVYDRTSGSYELLSRRPDGAPGNGSSGAGYAISDDGRYVAFVSESSDLVPGDTNGVADVFVHDRVTDQTTRVSLLPGGGQRTQPSPIVAISGDGAVVAFASSSPPPCDNCAGRSEVAVYDRTLGSVQVVNVGWDGSPANEFTTNGAVALDSTGRYVAFTSLAGNLVIGDSNNGGDVFLRDRGPTPACAYQVSSPVIDVGAGGGTTVVSIVTAPGCAWAYETGDPWLTASAGVGNGPAQISMTVASNPGAARSGYAALGGRRILVRQPGRLATAAPQFDLAGIGPTGQAFPTETYARGLSDDGRYVAFANEVRRLPSGASILRVYLRDRFSGTTIDVSHAPGGPADDPEISHDIHGSASEEGQFLFGGKGLTSDGRFLSFETHSTSSVTGCYVFDRVAGATTRMPDLGSIFQCPSMSRNGRYFTGVVPDSQTVRVHDRSTLQTVSFTFPGLAARDRLANAYSSLSGRYVTARVGSCNSVPCQEYGAVLDRTTGATARTASVPDLSYTLIGELLSRLVEPVWMDFGLPRFSVRTPLAPAECDLIDRQTRQVTALPELQALQGGPGNCRGFAVNGAQQIVFSTLRDLPVPGGTYQGISYDYVYTRATGVVSRLGPRPDGEAYPVFILAATPNGRYLLGQSRFRAGRPAAAEVTSVVVFDLGVSSDAVATAVPTNLQATVTGTTVRLTWDPPAQGTPAAYVIEAGSTTGASNLASFDTGSSASSLTTSAPPGTYYVRVRARSGSAVGGPSNEIVVNVGGACLAPPAPTGLTRTVNNSSVQLLWLAAAGATSYIVEAGSSSGASNLLVSNIGNLTTLNATAAPGTYYVRVRAVNACGSSAPSSEVVIVVAGCAPTIAPATPGATVTNGIVSLSWGAVPGATGYVVYAGLSTGASNAGVFQVSGTSLSGPAPRGRYYARVHARNACGLGPPSSEVAIDVP
jgi:hypothetical protein